MSVATMKILVIGSGGREHAIVSSLADSPLVASITAAPGNGGTASEPKTTNISLTVDDPCAVVDYALTNEIDLVVVGPEVPLVAGVADGLRAANIMVFGPGASGARLEGSKKFSKDFMARNNIPTAAYHCFTTEQADEAHACIERMGAPIVIKADGLAAGKGVIVATTMAQAQEGLSLCFEGEFGDAGDTVVIEECLTGPECSLLCFVDGTCVVPMAPAQDHKRAGDGDTGPNTGGMGVYSPVPMVSEATYQTMIDIMQDVANALASEGIEYRGVLYGGFMLTPEGPKVLEFNVRFGDPETQILLPRLLTDLCEVMCATATGDLADTPLEWDDLDGVSVVMASGGYPASCETGFEITGIDEAQGIDGVQVFQAGTKLGQEGEVLTSGGRVLNVTALAPTFKEAIERAYKAVDTISFEGAFSRRDIGARALSSKRY